MWPGLALSTEKVLHSVCFCSCSGKTQINLHLISTTSFKHILLEAKPAVVDLKRETSTDLLLVARFAQHSLAGAALLIPVPSY